MSEWSRGVNYCRGFASTSAGYCSIGMVTQEADLQVVGECLVCHHSS